jgi:membrane protease YdiL (CAAX protease family)
MTLRERLADVARFVARPTFAERTMAWRPGYVSAWALLVLLTLPTVLLTAGLLAAVLGPAGILPASTRDTALDLRAVLIAVVLAPVLEESLSRGWLSGRRAALHFAAAGLVALVVLLASLGVEPGTRKLVALVGVAVVFVGLVRWSLTRHRDREVPDWFLRHFRWLVWGSSLGFALLHLGNYEALTHPLGALVVAPLMLGGMLLAYTRTRLGLRAAMAHHAAYNAVLVAAAWAFG